MPNNFIGDYALIEKIGQGSLGETYLAEHRYLKQLFIVKPISQELVAEEGFIQRFESQVLLIAKLAHPYIAKICNACFIDGKYSLVTEAVIDDQERSMNLLSYLKEKGGRLDEEEVLQIARQISSAIDSAHAMRIAGEPVAHGCLKLNNILIRQKSGVTEAVITDFGLSRIISPPLRLSRVYHAVSCLLVKQQEIGEKKEVVGPLDLLHQTFFQTFAFLAPEQKISRNHSVKADIYAFGVLLYYLLTGEFPEGYFDLPSKKVPSLRWNWDLLICRALQTDPAKRPEGLGEKLEEMVLVTPVSPSRSSFKEKQGGHAKLLLKPQEIVRPLFEPDPGAVFQIDTTVATYKPEPKEEKEIEPIPSEMVIIPAGSFHRGSHQGGRDEMPRHPVILASFALDIHPVTNEQFVCFLEAMGGEKNCDNNDIIRLRESRIKRFGGRLSIESGYARHPVVGVTWYGAVAYAKWVGKRLPTEAEWEVAAYGGHEDFIYPTGNAIERSEANFFSSDTTAVMSYPPNDFGLFDMAGNVYEWCQDWYDYHFYHISIQEPNQPKGPAQGIYRVLRGGCWKSSKEDMRCAHRHRNNPGVMNGTYGFRCAADVGYEPS